MKNERIFYANDSDLAIEGFRHIIEKYAKESGHEVVASAGSVAEVRGRLRRGLRPSVFFLDPDFPTLKEGAEAVKIVKQISAETVVVTLSRKEGVVIGDYNLVAEIGARELIDFLTKIKR